MKTHRIPGFDLARAYAIFGMFIVNFNTVFGNVTSQEGLFGLLNAFNGNSSVLFVILAGMGVSLMTSQALLQPQQQPQSKAIVLKRSWFLFVFGLLFFLWWPADILHFYGGYMHLAAFLLFVPRSTLLWTAFGAILVFHLLWLFIPYDTGWDFQTFAYQDFWTVTGFLRNTFYNGWNPIFPWLAFFLLGMFLGRLNWQKHQTAQQTITIGALVYVLFRVFQYLLTLRDIHPDIKLYMNADYLPPFLPFMLSTASFSLFIIGLSIALGKRAEEKTWLRVLVQTGQMTLSHYCLHLTLGLWGLACLSRKSLSLDLILQPPSSAWLILGYALGYFLLTVIFSALWRRYFSLGPMEWLMRKLTKT
jgi:uncharacterized protein